MKRRAAATRSGRSSRALRWAAIVIAGASLPIAIARAAGEPVRVVVVATGAGDPVAARLIDELIAGGVTVEVTAEQTDPAAVLARTRGARAVVRVEASRRAVRIWRNDSTTNPETLTAEPGGDVDAAARSLALRVVEVLRPHLLPSEGPTASAVASPWPPVPLPPPTADPSASPAPIVAPTASALVSAVLPPLLPPRDTADAWPDSLSIYFSPALLLHPTTPIAPGAGALWGITKMVFPWAGVDICAIVPVVPGVLTTPAGQVKIAIGAIGAGALFRYPAGPSPITGWLGAGLAAGFIGYDAEVSSGAVRASDGVVAHALPYARAALEWRAWPSLGLRLDVIAGIARPRPVLQIAGQADTRLEEPLLGISLGALTWLP